MTGIPVRKEVAMTMKDPARARVTDWWPKRKLLAAMRAVLLRY